MKNPRMEVLFEILNDEPERWLTARDIEGRALRMGIKLPSRIVGDLASLSKGEIVGHGKGYKLSKYAADEDILGAYEMDFRRALGGEKRAREIIAFARSHGRLSNTDSEQKIREREDKVKTEITARRHEHYEEVALL
jgi:hypothetical protein